MVPRKSTATAKTVIGFMGESLPVTARNPFREASLAGIVYCRAGTAGKKSEQPKDGFDGDPCGHRALCSVARWNELPAVHRFYRAFIQSKTDASDHADVLRSPVRAHENRQRHRSLHLAVSRLIGVRRIGTISTGWLNCCRPEGRILIAVAGRSIDAIANAVAVFGPDAQAVSRSRRV